MPLHIDYRPQTLDEVVGNENIKESLQSIFAREDKPHAYLLHGPSGCLRGDTVIFDPIDKSNITVHERWERAKPFHVYSFSSEDEKMVVAEALPPVQYYEVEMFRVETSESVFFVTGEHRFLLKDGGYLSLKEISEKRFSEVPLVSTGEFCPSTQPQDEHHYSKKGVGSQYDYPLYHHSYDEQLPFCLKAFPNIAPLLNGVLSRIHALHSDDRVSLLKHNSHPLTFPLSKPYSFLCDELFFLQSKYLSYATTVGCAMGGHQILRPIDSESFPQNKGLKYESLVSRSVFALCDKFLSLFFSHKHLLASSSPPVGTDSIVFSTAYIKQITKVSKEKFYDFHVPIYNNYWASGLFHHNCGKTTIARIMAKMLKCSDQDFFEFNMSNLRGIDHVRELAINCHYSPVDGKVKVYLLDEIHRQTLDAQHAILKILEDTPPHAYFILCTTEPDRLLKTIHTRCSQYQTQSLDNKKLKLLIKRVLEQEKVVDFSATVINEIVRVSDGSPRQALVILDQVIDLDDDKALAAVNSFSVVEAEAIDICKAIVARADWKTMRPLVKATLLNTEAEKLRYAILGYLSAILLDKSDDRISALIDVFSESTFSSGKAGIVNMCYVASKI